LRQQVLVMVVFAISAFTCAVMAMAPILPRTSTTLGPPSHEPPHALTTRSRWAVSELCHRPIDA
jgi:hypothetical protein